MSKDLVASAVRLGDLLARENTALAALDLSGAAAMLAEKQEAAAGFALACERAGADAEGASLPAPELAALARRLDAAAAENRRLLERAVVVQGRVIATVARAVPRALAAAAPRYGAGGGAAPPARPAALAFSIRA